MLKAIGFVIMLYAISQIMSQPFLAFENAATATFKFLEATAEVSQQHVESLR